jgi:DNA polymerase III subunit delta
MQIKPDQLNQQMGRNIAPCYALSGEEPLQMRELGDLVRQRLRAWGAVERQIFEIADKGFDWAVFAHEVASRSLFASRRLIELRFGRTPDAAASAALRDYLARPVADLSLLITLPKLTARDQKSAWFNALDSAGVIVTVRPLDERALPAWIVQRGRHYGLQLEGEAVSYLALRTEGNLLAADQELVKLQLLYGAAKITLDEVREAIGSSARYDVFALGEAIGSGDTARVVRIIDTLRGEGGDPLLALWAVGREIRGLFAVTHGAQAGESVQEFERRHQLWGNRRQQLQQRARHSSPQLWFCWLQRLGEIDRLAKGIGHGNAWDELLCLALDICCLRQAHCGNVHDGRASRG